MKQLHKTRKAFAGILLAVMLVLLVLPASAATLSSRMIQVYDGPEIYIDSVKVDLKDANGKKVETFTYNGTTYVPLRAVSENLGKPVSYDGAARRVYIGEAPGQKQYLLNVCPPYQTREYDAPPTVTVGGKKYANCMTFGCEGWALFNLNGQYDTLSFDVGHIDGQGMHNGSLEIYLDNEVAFAMDLDPEALSEHIEIPLYGALQMKIALDSGYLWKDYAMYNVEIY